MSIIQQIREKYAVIGIGAIALSLIGFILMDSKKNGGGDRLETGSTIGNVAGKKITFGELGKLEESLAARYEQQGQPANKEMIASQAWESLVSSIIVGEEAKKLGISVTDKEFTNIIIESFRNDPSFKTETGEFKRDEAIQALAGLKSRKGEEKAKIELQLKEFYQASILTKYNNLISNATYYPKWMAEKTLVDNNAMANVSLVNIPYATVADSTIKISDEAIKTYIQEHQSKFKQDNETRSIAYVRFDVSPSKADTMATLATIQEFKTEFANAEKPGAFVNAKGSSSQFFDGYLSKDKIQIPQKDSIINAGIGRVYGPYLDANSYVLSRIVDTKVMPDSAKCRHILISFKDEKGQLKMNDEMAKAKADSIKGLLDKGQDFTLLAMQFSEDPGSKMKGGVYDFFEQGKMVKEFNDFCFEKPVGSVGVVRTDFGYHLIQNMAQKGSSVNYKIAYMSKQIEASQETVNEISTKANVFYGNSKTIKAFDDNATKNNYTKLVADEILENANQVQGIGNNRTLVKDIYDNDPGKVFEPIEVDGNYYVVAITGIQEKGLKSPKSVRSQVEPILINKEKAKIIIKKIGTVSTLEAVATANNVQVERKDSLMFNNPSINGIGYEPKFGGAIFNKAAIGKVSAPFAGQNGVFVYRTESVGAISAVGTTAEQIKQQAESSQKGALTNASAQALKKAANVKDLRGKI